MAYTNISFKYHTRARSPICIGSILKVISNLQVYPSCGISYMQLGFVLLGTRLLDVVLKMIIQSSTLPYPALHLRQQPNLVAPVRPHSKSTDQYGKFYYQNIVPNNFYQKKFWILSNLRLTSWGCPECSWTLRVTENAHIFL